MATHMREVKVVYTEEWCPQELLLSIVTTMPIWVTTFTQRMVLLKLEPPQEAKPEDMDTRAKELLATALMSILLRQQLLLCIVTTEVVVMLTTSTQLTLMSSTVKKGSMDTRMREFNATWLLTVESEDCEH